MPAYSIQCTESAKTDFSFSEADAFDQEVAVLRESLAFQHFLEQRQAEPSHISLDKLEREIDDELAARK